jgi:transcriptional regulator with XRE-family HTH domain
MPDSKNRKLPPEHIPDWVLGGVRRRQVLQLLRDEKGWTAKSLAGKIGCAEAWVYEIFRVLRSVNLLTDGETAGYRLARGSPLPDALAALIDALEPFADIAVDRPPSRLDTD